MVLIMKLVEIFILLSQPSGAGGRGTRTGGQPRDSLLDNTSEKERSKKLYEYCNAECASVFI